MKIIRSEITEQVIQFDGRISVTESHIYDSGTVQLHAYLAQQDWDLQSIADQRAANINAEIGRREQERLAASNFEAPITRREFLDKLTPSRRIQLRELAKTNAALEDALAYLDAGDEVFRSRAAAWLNSLAGAGLFTEDEVSAILASW